MINFNKYQKITNWKNLREKVPIGKNLKNLEILKFLDKGLYAQEISQKTLFSPKKLSRIINSFKSRNLIEFIDSYPKRYKCTNLGKLILAQGDLNQKRIQEFIPDKEFLPKGIESVRIHKLRFKNKLVQKPLWLNQIRDKGIINGLNIKRIELNNWTKFLIFFNYQDFNGLEKIEVCNDVIIYNFNRNIDEQYVSSNEELDNYFEDVISNCKQARTFLQQKGFIIDEKDPEFCQKPHFAIKSNGDPRVIGTLGQFLNVTIETLTETREIDDSPPKKKGEEETDIKLLLEDKKETKEKIGELYNELVDTKNFICNLMIIVSDSGQKDLIEKIGRFPKYLKKIEELNNKYWDFSQKCFEDAKRKRINAHPRKDWYKTPESKLGFEDLYDFYLEFYMIPEVSSFVKISPRGKILDVISEEEIENKDDFIGDHIIIDSYSLEYDKIDYKKFYTPKTDRHIIIPIKKKNHVKGDRTLEEINEIRSQNNLPVIKL